MEAGIHELTAGYALDALDADERAAYEAHLAGCEQCQEELASFWRDDRGARRRGLGPGAADGLRDRILDAARAPSRTSSCRSSRTACGSCRVLAAVAAAAAAVAHRARLWAAHLSSELDEPALGARPPACGRRAARRPGGANGRAQHGRRASSSSTTTGRAALVLDGLEAAPAGKTYETWIIADGNAEAARGLVPGAEPRRRRRRPRVGASGDVVAVDRRARRRRRRAPRRPDRRLSRSRNRSSRGPGTEREA